MQEMMSAYDRLVKVATTPGKSRPFLRSELYDTWEAPEEESDDRIVAQGREFKQPIRVAGTIGELTVQLAVVAPGENARQDNADPELFASVFFEEEGPEELIDRLFMYAQLGLTATNASEVAARNEIAITVAINSALDSENARATTPEEANIIESYEPEVKHVFPDDPDDKVSRRCNMPLTQKALQRYTELRPEEVAFEDFFARLNRLCGKNAIFRVFRIGAYFNVLPTHIFAIDDFAAERVAQE